MTIKKETELTRAIIVYCQRCQEEGDFQALHEMGFGPREISALQSLTTTDALRLASTRSHFLTIKINPEIYWRMIDYINREHMKNRIIDDLIRNEAPLPMVHALTGMGSKEFIQKRHQYGLGVSSRGRPATPTQEIADRVWVVLQSSFESSQRLGAKEFMGIYEALNSEVSLRVIWFLTKQWDRDGSLKTLFRTAN